MRVVGGVEVLDSRRGPRAFDVEERAEGIPRASRRGPRAIDVEESLSLGREHSTRVEERAESSRRASRRGPRAVDARRGGGRERTLRLGKLLIPSNF